MLRNRICVAVLPLTLCSGCLSIQEAALNNVSAMLSGPESGAVFASDGDPELVRDSLPFIMKMHEILLSQTPDNAELQLAAGRIFIQYANAFVEADAQRVKDTDYSEYKRLRDRARGLYLRGRDYALQGLRIRKPHTVDGLIHETERAVAKCDKRDVPYLFWIAAGWGGAIASGTDQMELVGELPVVSAILDRILEVDEEYERGAVHELLIALESAKGEMGGGSIEKAEVHLQEAVRITAGKSASAYVTAATSIAIPQQDLRAFRRWLKAALAIDVNETPSLRLSNILAKKKARWLLDHGEEYFLDWE